MNVINLLCAFHSILIYSSVPFFVSFFHQYVLDINRNSEFIISTNNSKRRNFSSSSQMRCDRLCRDGCRQSSNHFPIFSYFFINFFLFFPPILTILFKSIRRQATELDLVFSFSFLYLLTISTCLSVCLSSSPFDILHNNSLFEMS